LVEVFSHIYKAAQNEFTTIICLRALVQSRPTWHSNLEMKSGIGQFNKKPKKYHASALKQKCKRYIELLLP